MSYYGNTPSWVYKHEISRLKAARNTTERMNGEEVTKAIQKVLGVVDYSIISMWCDLNGYYYPIKKDFEKLEQMDKLEKQIQDIESEISGIKYKFGLSWRENDELRGIDARIAERKAEIKLYENTNSKLLRKEQSLLKGALTRRNTLMENKERCDSKIAEESRVLIERQNDLRQKTELKGE